jgi:hypothetical protein
MDHPFVNNLSEKSLEELQKTISDLTGKLTYAYRMQNGPLINQLNMALSSYRSAYSKKMDEMIQKQKINTKISVESDKK